MKVQKYIVEITMPDNDCLSADLIKDAIEAYFRMEVIQWGWKVNVECDS